MLRLFGPFPVYRCFVPDGGTMYRSMIWVLSGVVGVAWAMLYGTGLIASRMVGVECYILFPFLNLISI